MWRHGRLLCLWAGPVSYTHLVRDTLACVELALLHPAERGEFRVFNQFTEQFNVMQLAETVREVAHEFNLKVSIDHLPNPRVEKEEHYYCLLYTSRCV